MDIQYIAGGPRGLEHTRRHTLSLYTLAQKINKSDIRRLSYFTLQQGEAVGASLSNFSELHYRQILLRARLAAAGAELVLALIRLEQFSSKLPDSGSARHRKRIQRACSSYREVLAELTTLMLSTPPESPILSPPRSHK